MEINCIYSMKTCPFRGQLTQRGEVVPVTGPMDVTCRSGTRATSRAGAGLMWGADRREAAGRVEPWQQGKGKGRQKKSTS